MTPAVFVPSYSNLTCYDCSHIEHVCTLYFVCTSDNIFGIVELRHYYVYTNFGVFTLFICVLSAILILQTDLIPLYSKLCRMIVRTFKMCIGDAGPEQSLVLSLFLRDPFFQII